MTSSLPGSKIADVQVAIPNSKLIEGVPALSPSSPSPCLDAHNLEETSRSMRRFSQFWEKGSRKGKHSFLLPLPSLGEGWGEGKPMCHSHLISEFGIADVQVVEIIEYQKRGRLRKDDVARNTIEFLPCLSLKLP
jgi:hypothetical protein